jgi:hypothetical protein
MMDEVRTSETSVYSTRLRSAVYQKAHMFGAFKIASSCTAIVHCSERVLFAAVSRNTFLQD